MYGLFEGFVNEHVTKEDNVKKKLMINLLKLMESFTRGIIKLCDITKSMCMYVFVDFCKLDSIPDDMLRCLLDVLSVPSIKKLWHCPVVIRQHEEMVCFKNSYTIW